MPKMPVQNAPPTSPSSSTLGQLPLRCCRRRARPPRRFGMSRVHSPGWVASVAPNSALEDRIELMLAEPAGELEEHVLQRAAARGGLLAQLSQGPLRRHLPS